MSGLTGRRIVVTGASRGIGRAVADRLAAAGARVMSLSRSTPSVSAAGETHIACDLADADAVDRAAETMLAAGPPDGVIHNAGAFLLKPAADTTAEEFAAQLTLTLAGPFRLLRTLMPGLATAGGHLVTVGSIADHRIFPGNVAYGSAKHGLRAMHETLALEYQGRIRATLVSPGPTDTAVWDPYDPDARDDLPDRSVMLRADDVAEAIVWALLQPRHVNVDLIRVGPSGLSDD